MAGTVTSIASRYPLRRLFRMLIDEQVKAEYFGTPLPDSAWFHVCELEKRLPELRLLIDTVADDDIELTAAHLGDILNAAKEVMAAHSPTPTAA